MSNNTKTTAVAFAHHNPTQQLLPHLLALVADMKACPPERGLWRTAVAAAIGDNLQFIDAGRPVSAALVHQVAWALYGRSNRAGIIDDWSVQRLAQDCRRPKGERGVRSALNVINGIGLAVKDRPSRRLPWVWKLNVGGLDWPMVYNRAAALHKPSPVTMTGLSPVMVTGLKGSVQGQVDLVAADHVAGSTTSAAAPTEDQQQQWRDESRLEGLIGYLAVTSRALDHPFNEDRVREDLAAGRTTVGNLQRQAEELRPASAARAGEAAAARALERSGGHAAAFKCGACETMQYPEPGGRCPGCGEAMR